MATTRIDVGLSWLILCLCGRLWTSRTPAAGVSAMDEVPLPYMDVLLPYTDGHGPRHSHRHVRDCQPHVHGNHTHESFPASNQSSLPVAEVRLAIYKLPGRVVTGHFTVVHDPLRTLSVLEPGRPGGCGSYRLATVEETSQAAGCLYAQNAGFFNTHTGQCLGNVVSDGRMVQDSGGMQNAQFGIRRDGTLVFGYLSQEEVLDQSNPFVQLVSGVVWLLRNGEVYIKSSMTAECDKMQETGSFHHFAEVMSARTALGHDANGRVILLQVDGQTGERGKADKRWHCARAVSTILCVHPQPCHPSDCGAHGVCAASGCFCDAGWRDKNCSQECLPGFYGEGCNQTCSCMNSDSCHHVHGGCSCTLGFTGKSCEECLPGYYGNGCNQTCSCMNGGLCHHIHNNCSCTPGYTGKTCEEECLPGFYGDGCNQTCSCMNGGSCHHIHGGCMCSPGFTGKTCEEECRPGFYGDGCNQKCPCVNAASCHHVSGSCSCSPGFTGKTCEEVTDERSQAKEQEQKAYHLTEATWLTITIILSILLLLSLLALVVQLCGYPLATRMRANFTYLPLSTFDGGDANGGGPGKWDRDFSNSLELI
ncbi:N-acetylglucosamine-1-phosphodiester alpha-N-acetylglucosaminidase isoform X2 [Phyllopteryx taeniolatus]|uniref:N-acetylglucosamine-1-phosphodiester alpha-N-acetylglucosaminidase isoform X2 n=1 Tax=Phyllopteryx taeniolatus TaxID=161469 RepID=UPI002AD3BC8D|nr:N-acetylglucosamine-1-phosphodiester alpha-N-acetylglucosaminidase isoform X2 [Phyllopteryx taeniolatus]